MKIACFEITAFDLKQCSYLKCSYLKMGSHGNALAVSFNRRRAGLRSRAHDFHYNIKKWCGKLGRSMFQLTFDISNFNIIYTFPRKLRIKTDKKVQKIQSLHEILEMNNYVHQAMHQNKDDIRKWYVSKSKIASKVSYGFKNMMLQK